MPGLSVTARPRNLRPAQQDSETVLGRLTNGPRQGRCDRPFGAAKLERQGAGHSWPREWYGAFIRGLSRWMRLSEKIVKLDFDSLCEADQSVIRQAASVKRPLIYFPVGRKGVMRVSYAWRQVFVLQHTPKFFSWLPPGLISRRRA